MSTKYLQDVVIVTGMNLERDGSELEGICGVIRDTEDGVDKLSLTISGAAHDRNPGALRELAQKAADQTVKIRRYSLSDTLETIHPKRKKPDDTVF